jgi:D-glycerate 3-kinase
MVSSKRSVRHEYRVRGFPDDLVEAVLATATPRRGGAPRVVGITGLQGSGKSTLAAQVVEAAGRRGRRAAALSIDDVYLTRQARLRLARDVHPLLVTRGPPGTHDLPLAVAVLDAVRAGSPVNLPRFDKLGDDRLPESAFTQVCDPLDVLVFEGWFLKTPPEEEAALAQPINALEREEDADGRFRRWCNAALGRDYPALWRRIDVLWFLEPPSFEIVPEWRFEQELAMGAADPGRRTMSREEVGRFVQHFERVGRHSLRTLPAIADHTIELDEGRQPIRTLTRA